MVQVLSTEFLDNYKVQQTKASIFTKTNTLTKLFSHFLDQPPLGWKFQKKCASVQFGPTRQTMVDVLVMCLVIFSLQNFLPLQQYYVHIY